MQTSDSAAAPNIAGKRDGKGEQMQMEPRRCCKLEAPDLLVPEQRQFKVLTDKGPPPPAQTSVF